MLGGGGLPWHVAKTVAGLAAGALGAWIRHGPHRQDDALDGLTARPFRILILLLRSLPTAGRPVLPSVTTC
jgi:hypothetical protein